MSTPIWIVGAYGTSHTIQCKSKKCASLYPFTHGTSLECCVDSMDVTPLFGCLCNSISTSPMYSLMNWEGYQCLHGWFELMVYHIPSNAEAKSAFRPSMLVHPWGIVWSVWMWSPCVVVCATVYQPHPCTHWWIERGIDTCMDGWSSWYITHHPMQRLNVCHFSFLYACPSVQCCMASMDVITLRGCLYNGASTSLIHI